MDNSKQKSPFSNDFLNKLYTDPVRKQVFNSLLNGITPYQVIESLCNIIEDTNNALSNLIEHGPQPKVIVTTQARYDSMVSENKIIK